MGFRHTPGQPLVKYIHRMDGSVITSRTVALTNPWSAEWIGEAFAGEYNCRADDVSCVEADDGEFFVIDGERVGYVEVN